MDLDHANVIVSPIQLSGLLRCSALGLGKLSLEEEKLK